MPIHGFEFLGEAAASRAGKLGRRRLRQSPIGALGCKLGDPLRDHEDQAQENQQTSGVTRLWSELGLGLTQVVLQL